MSIDGWNYQMCVLNIKLNVYYISNHLLIIVELVPNSIYVITNGLYEYLDWCSSLLLSLSPSVNCQIVIIIICNLLCNCDQILLDNEIHANMHILTTMCFQCAQPFNGYAAEKTTDKQNKIIQIAEKVSRMKWVHKRLAHSLLPSQYHNTHMHIYIIKYIFIKNRASFVRTSSNHTMYECTKERPTTNSICVMCVCIELNRNMVCIFYTHDALNE